MATSLEPQQAPTEDPDAKPLIWPAPFCLAVILLCIAVPFRWRASAIAAIFQGLGVVLTALGLAAIGDRLRSARDSAAAAFARARSWAAALIIRLRQWCAVTWARLTRQPRSVVVHAVSAHDRASASDNATATVYRHRVDRDAVSDREWLAYLDDRLESVFERLDAAEKDRREDREDFARRLGIQRDQLRAEIIRETRNGWQLVAWGLTYGLISAVFAGFA